VEAGLMKNHSIKEIWIDEKIMKLDWLKICIVRGSWIDEKIVL